MSTQDGKINMVGKILEFSQLDSIGANASAISPNPAVGLAEGRQKIREVASGTPTNSTSCTSPISGIPASMPSNNNLSPFRDICSDNRVLISDQIGSGASGQVYMGIVNARGIEIPVAVKILHQHLLHTVTEERFIRESELICRLSHPSLVRGFGIGDAPTPFVVMELVEGKSLLELMHEGPMGFERSIDITMQVLNALEYLHLDGRVTAHRDIKPSNIMVSSSGFPKLIDLGVARTSMVAKSALRTKLAGTIHYMAPEQMANSSRADIRSDIYSMGIVMFEMIVGSNLAREDDKALLEKRFTGLTPEIPIGLCETLKIRPETAIKLNQVMGTACAYEPSRRYQTPEQMSEDLRELLRTSSSSCPANVRHRDAGKDEIAEIPSGKRADKHAKSLAHIRSPRPRNVRRNADTNKPTGRTDQATAAAVATSAAPTSAMPKTATIIPVLMAIFAVAAISIATSASYGSPGNPLGSFNSPGVHSVYLQDSERSIEQTRPTPPEGNEIEVEIPMPSQ